jgi:hypothetical protein
VHAQQAHADRHPHSGNPSRADSQTPMPYS